MINNHLAWELFQKVSGQMIVAGMGEPLGINFLAIDFILDIYGILKRDKRREMFDKIILFDSIRLRKRSEQISSQRERDKIKNQTSSKRN